ncbi:T9SS type A sorting domain-containing protein, partial [candidate division KSB1 bacterium]|nr:T9SS type A sorting domain-containing protein [candidate division KSB1 bacterium]
NGDIFIPVFQKDGVQPVVKELPAGLYDGINELDDSRAALVLYAPHKNNVYVIGDFNNWQPSSDYLMYRTPDSLRYWLELDTEPGMEVRYQYLVDEFLRIADPFAEKVLDPDHDFYIDNLTYPDLLSYPTGKTSEIVGVLQTGKPPFPWENTGFQRPAVTDLVIYELLLRDFLQTHSFTTLADTLGYFKKLGVNAIELMPVNEFEGNSSWGYNPSFYFAVDKYYGPAENLKRFIDKAHKNGIAVILDIVLNHAYGQCPLVRLYTCQMYLNPWFNEVSPNPVYAWGYDFNHESRAAQDFIDRVTSYWLTEFQVDGFRLDFTKGFTNTPGDGGSYDADRIRILKRLADHIWSEKTGAYIILEHFCSNKEEKELSDYGMLIWGNMNYNYNEATMGYHDDNKSDFSGISWVKRGWTQPHLVGYMESHDEQRLMYKNLQYGNSSSGYNIQSLSTALERIQPAAAFFFTIPGPKMIWQFGELGYDVDIDQNGRTGPKPIRWDYFKDRDRRRLFDIYAALIRLKIDCPAFESRNYELDLAEPVKRIFIQHDSLNVVVLGNFDVRNGYARPNFPHTGWWYDYFPGDSLLVDDPNAVLAMFPGEYRIYTDKKEIITFTPQNPFIKDFYLYQNYPNPFNTSTIVRVDVNKRDRLTVEIFNLRGQHINTLVDRVQDPGQYEFEWMGTGFSGSICSSGVYVCRVEHGKKTKYGKMLLVK